MKITALLGIFFMGMLSQGKAADAFFSPDGSVVTFISLLAEGGVWQLNLGTKELKKVPLGEPLKSKTILSIAKGAQGELLFLTEEGAWVHSEKGIRPLAKLGTAVTPNDLCAAPPNLGPLSDCLFVSALDKSSPESGEVHFHFRKPGTKEFAPVFCRRISHVSAGSFAADGRFFFAGEGDLWEGGFEMDATGGGAPCVLSGVRIAPLAMMNTDAGNGGNMWVDQVEAAGKHVYVRLAGRHMGAIVRVPMPEVPATAEKSPAMGGLADHYKFLQEALGKVHIIVDTADEITASAAAMVNGKAQVFFRRAAGDGKHGLWLWEEGSTEPLPVGMEKQ
jgi:hypothetical protein